MKTTSAIELMKYNDSHIFINYNIVNNIDDHTTVYIQYIYIRIDIYKGYK